MSSGRGDYFYGPVFTADLYCEVINNLPLFPKQGAIFLLGEVVDNQSRETATLNDPFGFLLLQIKVKARAQTSYNV